MPSKNKKIATAVIQERAVREALDSMAQEIEKLRRGQRRIFAEGGSKTLTLGLGESGDFDISIPSIGQPLRIEFDGLFPPNGTLANPSIVSLAAASAASNAFRFWWYRNNTLLRVHSLDIFLNVSRYLTPCIISVVDPDPPVEICTYRLNISTAGGGTAIIGPGRLIGYQLG
jgi:hypothetical protein